MFKIVKTTASKINGLCLCVPVNLLIQPISHVSSKRGIVEGPRRSRHISNRPFLMPPPGTGRGKVLPPTGLVRAKQPGKVRLGFIPEEWFLFMHSLTGVSGPYLLILGLANYVASKEILVMEHEYYSGLSVALVLYLITKNFGRQIGDALDTQVLAHIDGLYKTRDEEKAQHIAVLNEGKLLKAQARAQETLMAAKKENIALQLEAEYRERLMKVYRAVRDRLLYHSKRTRTINRIQQRWMIQWILENVSKSITPEFQKQALSSAIRDLAAAASHAKK